MNSYYFNEFLINLNLAASGQGVFTPGAQPNGTQPGLLINGTQPGSPIPPSNGTQSGLQSNGTQPRPPSPSNGTQPGRPKFPKPFLF